MKLERLTAGTVEVIVDPAREFRNDLSESRLAHAALRSFAEAEEITDIEQLETYSSLSQKLKEIPIDIINPTRLALTSLESAMLRQAALRAANLAGLRVGKMREEGRALTSGFGIYSDEMVRLNVYSQIVDQLPPQMLVGPDDLSKAA